MKEEIWRLIHEENQHAEKAALPLDVLRASFEAAWPGIEANLNAIWHSEVVQPSTETPPSEATASQPRKAGRRISSFEELVELWPALLMRIRKKIGVTAVAYLHDATPFAFDDEQIVLAFTKQFHYQKALDSMQRLPYEDTINQVLDTPRELKFILQDNATDTQNSSTDE